MYTVINDTAVLNTTLHAVTPVASSIRSPLTRPPDRTASDHPGGAPGAMARLRRVPQLALGRIPPAQGPGLRAPEAALLRERSHDTGAAAG